MRGYRAKRGGHSEQNVVGHKLEEILDYRSRTEFDARY